MSLSTSFQWYRDDSQWSQKKSPNPKYWVNSGKHRSNWYFWKFSHNFFMRLFWFHKILLNTTTDKNCLFWKNLNFCPDVRSFKGRFPPRLYIIRYHPLKKGNILGANFCKTIRHFWCHFPSRLKINNLALLLSECMLWWTDVSNDGIKLEIINWTYMAVN